MVFNRPDRSNVSTDRDPLLNSSTDNGSGPSSGYGTDSDAPTKGQPSFGGSEDCDTVITVEESRLIQEAINGNYRGLTDSEARFSLQHYGYNELKEKKPSKLLKFLSYFTGSISYLIEAACILSAVLKDWTDFGIILGLLVVNACIGYIEEARAESAVDALKQSLALKSKVVRDGIIQDIDAREIVPGDVLSLRLGDVIPADCVLLGVASNGQEAMGELQVDQSALTGESLPVGKSKGDHCYSSSIVKQGQQLAVAVATGPNTFLGRAATLIENTEHSGHFQKVIGKIGDFLIVITLVMVAIILIVAVSTGQNFLDQLEYALVLTIASIPVGLPTVLSVTMAVGAKKLAAKQVIVKRLTAVEQMAGISILCSDKTGTLTLNELSLDKPYLVSGQTNEQLLFAAYLASEPGTNDAIEKCVRESAHKIVPELRNADPKTGKLPRYVISKFQPFDPVSKLTQATVIDESSGQLFKVAKGAPQVILSLCNQPDTREAQRAIAHMAKHGLRALAVARSRPMTADEANDSANIRWELVGMLSLLDPPRPDSGETIRRCQDYGLQVKMITGDQLLIAKEVSYRLGLQRNILNPSILPATETLDQDPQLLERTIDRVLKCDGFAQVSPSDKFNIVEILQKSGRLLGMTGDGVNDAPALKKADVGIAVHGCTDAARMAADIVLLTPGLSPIVDGIVESRMIFQRMRSYALYRITSTIHFLIFLFFAILLLDFFLPAKLIVLIALLNDAATIVISIDNAKISPKPDKWKLGQLIALSALLGVILTGASFGTYFISKHFAGVTEDQLYTIMYLQMSSCPHFVIFSTRLSVPFYENPPSLIFFIAIVGTQIFALFISVYGLLTEPIGWMLGGTVMASSVGFFFILDAAKCWLYSVWSFRLTAYLWPTRSRRERLRKMQEQKLKREDMKRLIARMRKVTNAVKFSMKFRSFKPLPEAEVHIPTHHKH